MVECTVSGELPPSDAIDLRILLRIRGPDAIGQISSLLTEDVRLEYDRLSLPFRAALLTMRLTGIEWRGRDPRSLMPSSHVDGLMSALSLAHGETRALHVEDGYDELRAVARLFEDAEWRGVRVESDVIPSLHTNDGRLHPQVDVIPRELTGRMGTRGGFNVMAWERGTRHALRPSPGMGLFSIDFNAMDLHSLASLEESGALRDVISSDPDAYAALSREIFGATGEQLRAVLKGSFLPFAYGAGIGAIATTLDVSHESAAKLWERYRPWLDPLGTGPELARLVQGMSSTVFRACLARVARSQVCDLGIRALFPVHDELLLESGDPLAVLYAREMMELQSAALTGVRYRTVVKRGPDYGHMEKLC